MSAADRDYWKRPEGSYEPPLIQWPLTYWLMAVLVVCFAGQCLNDAYGSRSYEMAVALTNNALSKGWVWQFVTFQFLHGDLLHLLFNLLALYFFGRAVEQALGVRRFVLAYLSCGVAGGLLQAILMWAFPQQYAGMVVGASAGIAGLFVMFCLFNPHACINLMMLVPVPARVALYVTAAIEIFFTLVPSGRSGSVAHAAHLGGMVFAALWIRWGWHHEWTPLPGGALWDRFKTVFYRPRRTPPLKVLQGGAGVGAGSARVRATPPPAPAPAAELPAAEFIAREVDPILDKIAAHGMASLTERERQVLAAAREKVARR